MIPPSQQDPAQTETSNFFQRTTVGGSDITNQTIKMQTIVQDAHTLQKLAQSCDIAHFLNKTSATDDCDISAIATLAGNISQALDAIVSGAPRAQANKDKPKRSRSPLTNTGSPKRCSECGVSDTPRWRRKSPGSPRLCNFCSLIGAKRATRKYPESRAASVSTRFSWPN